MRRYDRGSMVEAGWRTGLDQPVPTLTMIDRWCDDQVDIANVAEYRHLGTVRDESIDSPFEPRTSWDRNHRTLSRVIAPNPAVRTQTNSARNPDCSIETRSVSRNPRPRRRRGTPSR